MYLAQETFLDCDMAMSSRSIYVSRCRRKSKEKALAYLGGRCWLCGYFRCPAALEFHHVDPTQKAFEIGSQGAYAAWDKLKSELDKCALLCSNCHKEVHAKIVEVTLRMDRRSVMLEKVDAE